MIFGGTYRGCLNFLPEALSKPPILSQSLNGAFPIWARARHTRNFMVKGQRSRESLPLILSSTQTPYHKHPDYGQSTFFVLFSFFFALFLSEKPSLLEKQKNLKIPIKSLHLRRERYLLDRLHLTFPQTLSPSSSLCHNNPTIFARPLNFSLVQILLQNILTALHTLNKSTSRRF
jgi:hypothetical protein